MTWAYIGAAAVSTAASMAKGTDGQAAPAPTYNPSTGQVDMIDTSFAPEDLGGGGDLAAIMAQYFQPSESTDTVGAEVAGLPLPIDTPNVQAAPDAGVPDWFREGSGGFVDQATQGGSPLANPPMATPGIGDMMGPPEADVPSFLGGLGEGLGGFFGNMDQNLDSPSKTLGMGLLGQIDPRLGYAGLLSMGLFGKNKLFGK